MKIWCKSLTRITRLDTDKIIDNIFLELDKPTYRITKERLNYVEFKENKLRADWNFNQYRYINGGTIEINPETKKVILRYYLDPIYDIIFNSIILLFCIFKDGKFSFFFIASGISFLIRLITHRNVAEGIIDRVANS